MRKHSDVEMVVSFSVENSGVSDRASWTVGEKEAKFAFGMSKSEVTVGGEADNREPGDAPLKISFKGLRDPFTMCVFPDGFIELVRERAKEQPLLVDVIRLSGCCGLLDNDGQPMVWGKEGE